MFDGAAERFERGDEVAVLLIQVLFAFGRGLILLDGRKVDRPQALYPIRDTLQLLCPGAFRSFRRQRLAHSGQRQPGCL